VILPSRAGAGAPTEESGWATVESARSIAAPSSEGVAKPSDAATSVVILRERTHVTGSNATVCVRPKDLLSAREGLAPKQKSGPTVLPARSFGRRQSLSYKQVAERRLPQDDSFACEVWKHPLRHCFSGSGMRMSTRIRQQRFHAEDVEKKREDAEGFEPPLRPLRFPPRPLREAVLFRGPVRGAATGRRRAAGGPRRTSAAVRRPAP
jgi:hypothetical protein